MSLLRFRGEGEWGGRHRGTLELLWQKRRTAVAVDLTEATPMSPPGRGGLRRVREPVINCPWPQLCL